MNKGQPVSVTIIIIVDIMKDSFYLLAKTLQTSRSQ